MPRGTGQGDDLQGTGRRPKASLHGYGQRARLQDKKPAADILDQPRARSQSISSLRVRRKGLLRKAEAALRACAFSEFGTEFQSLSQVQDRSIRLSDWRSLGSCQIPSGSMGYKGVLGLATTVPNATYLRWALFESSSCTTRTRLGPGLIAVWGFPCSSNVGGLPCFHPPIQEVERGQGWELDPLCPSHGKFLTAAQRIEAEHGRACTGGTEHVRGAVAACPR